MNIFLVILSACSNTPEQPETILKTEEHEVVDGAGKRHTLFSFEPEDNIICYYFRYGERSLSCVQIITPEQK